MPKYLYDVTLEGTFQRGDTSERQVQTYWRYIDEQLLSRGLTATVEYDFRPLEAGDEVDGAEVDEDDAKLFDPILFGNITVKAQLYAYSQHDAIVRARLAFYDAIDDADLCVDPEFTWL